MISTLQKINPIYFNLYTWGFPQGFPFGFPNLQLKLSRYQLEILCCIEEQLMTKGKNDSFKLCLLYEPTDKNVLIDLNNFDCVVEIGTGKSKSNNHFMIPLESNRNIIIKLLSEMINNFTSENIIIYISNNKEFPAIYRKFRIVPFIKK